MDKRSVIFYAIVIALVLALIFPEQTKDMILALKNSVVHVIEGEGEDHAEFSTDT